MEKKTIQGDGVPEAIGPYSAAIEMDGWIFVSGQIPKDPTNGEIRNADITQATRQCLENLRAVLHASGASLDDVVKVNVYMTNLEEFPAMNKTYAEYFGDSRPARATVQVAALPAGARIEIDCIAKSPGN